MRAIVVRRFGGPEVLESIEVPVPEPGRGQVRIRVAAAAVNPVDLATRAGILTGAGVIPPREVLGLGWDVAGVIEAVGEAEESDAREPGSPRQNASLGRPSERARLGHDDSLGEPVPLRAGGGPAAPAGGQPGRFRVGDPVIGLRDRLATPLGAYAEQVVLDASAVAPAPPGLSPLEAATLPLNALTAAQALDLVGTTGTLLVTGAAGAVGGYAVALAHARKLHVIAVAADADEAAVRDFGADRFVPRGPDLAERVRALVPGGVDAVLDTALLGLDALDAVRGGGEFVAFAAGAAPIPLRGIRVRDVWIRADGERLAELAGALRPRVAGVLPLSRAAEAHERLAAGGLRGRLVLTP
ncbi:NADPH:quinone reductase [Amycolatopsis sp. NBRC 101858]|uniref:NADP-dependent oxidoreductase n=1 Tax=Amycolatopsis sp. NBRC 101858 TaxID=3032200 RepID=UPI0024A2C33E|nr:NADP-dependent oxidoreductase [Amycolatopsis sp. NBRC 101858]GLY37100.1 NADPH:quinone reductase [Amycolatopsis sp. NBRC 101858]